MWEVTQIGNINKGLVEWPGWVEYLTHISHVTTTLTSSTNLYIYAAKVRHYNQQARSYGPIEIENTYRISAYLCFKS